MDKEIVDKTITRYIEKIYGFALNKTASIDLAEELASRITFEVYKSLLKAENVLNIDGYVFRIASNIYAKFLYEENELTSQNEDINILNPSVLNDTEKENTHIKLRREIAYLSKIKREIIVMFYYDNLKLKDIAEKLQLPLGTVGRYLNETREQLRTGYIKNMEKVRKTEKTVFTDMKMIGRSGLNFTEASFYFQMKYIQNIVYLAFHNPKSANEIANDLGIPMAFIEDELNYLVENSFMSKLPGNKYVTNILIIENNKIKKTETNEILIKYSNIITEKFINSVLPNLIDLLTKDIKDYFYVPDNDFNFLLWSMISYFFSKKNESPDILKFMQNRQDGGHNFLIASVSNENDHQFQESFKNVISCMYTKKHADPISKFWQYCSIFDTRNYKYTDCSTAVLDLLNDFIKGNLPKNANNLEKYISLYDKGLIINKKKKDYLNIVVTNIKEEILEEKLPKLDDIFFEESRLLDEEIYQINKIYFPKHLHELSCIINKNQIRSGHVRIHILENLLKLKIIKPLKKHQKKTVNIIMFAEKI